MSGRHRAFDLLERAAETAADRDALLDLLGRSLGPLSREPSLVGLPPRELMVVGDLHGHLGATEWVVRRSLAMPRTHVVTLGDYADRGDRQLATVVALLMLRLERPGSVTLLRGNHETRAMASRFGLEDEVLSVHDRGVMDAILEVFAQLPIAAHRDDGVLCLHGGIPRSMGSLEVLAAVPKGEEEPTDGTTIEVLWNDPEERPGGFAFNGRRGIGQTFGLDASRDLMARTGLWLLLRAHQPSPGGFERLHGGRVVSVFSHPGYMGTSTEGAVAIVGMDRTVRPFRIDVRERAADGRSEPPL